MSKGKFIVIYGVNGTGKSTQVKNILRYLKGKKIKVNYLKYPIYDLEPEGPFIDKYLRDPEFRKKNPQTTEKLQDKYAKNRKRFEPELKKILEKGEWLKTSSASIPFAARLTWCFSNSRISFNVLRILLSSSTTSILAMSYFLRKIRNNSC